MATGNSSGLGSSIFRGALHGNTSNTGTSNNQQHHHHSNHQLQVAGPSHHHQHLTQQQPQQQQPQQQSASSSQSHMSMGAAIFTPEQHHQGQSTPGSPDHMTTLMAKLWFDHNVESSLRDLKKEEHEKRMRDLRKQLEHIADTNWKYSPVEKYIGQQ
ncbi:putative cyclin-dependent serine/threonine-protein kinase DDB_G0272797/DDB_G0274007 [Palaemon carinicauda]|uniref:putative cyclin-dependent serine/threonine-protein kinase DDB_G0272797/DDB_G0274007 n=1 Tax=Palaemon carinicauda TaxID=392227 RepID=UPI0035B691B7